MTKEQYFIAREIKNAIEKGKTITGLARNIATQYKLDGVFDDRDVIEFLQDCGIE